MLIHAATRDAIRRRLLGWYDAGHRDLPWRFGQHGADPYRVWLAEVMLQQTQVATVVPYFRRFVERWPTLEALAAAGDEEVLAQWSGLGYYARCRNLLAAARAALRRHGGLPASLEALRALPGFGRYTAGAVASMAFAIPAPVVDGNVARVLARVFLLEESPGQRAVQGRLWELAGELAAADRPGDFNQALMELGATVCRWSDPLCPACPLAPVCQARRAGRQAQVPRTRQRAIRKQLRLACALVERRGRLLLARRPARGLFGGLWELPSAEVAGNAAAPRTLSCALATRLGIRLQVGALLARERRLLTHREVRLEAYRCRLLGGPAREQRRDLRWVEHARIGACGMPTAMRRLLEAAIGAVARGERGAF